MRTWDRLPQVGDRIVEKQSGSTPKTITEVAEGQYVVARGLNTRRIAWRSLDRYRLVEGQTR